jgi:branched-chain amino acid transport system substrate-binding protein
VLARRTVIGGTLALTAVAAACTNGGDSSPTTTAAVTTTTIFQRPSDGQLTLGILRPGGDTVLNDSVVDGALQAVNAINAAGGVLGDRIRVIEADEGTSIATAANSIETLLTAGVDAIIGPSDSTIALGTLDRVVSAGVVACSPTAATLALDDFPDSGYFFRTIPSDSLQAVAIAEVAEQTGALTAAVAYVDDVYGRPYADAVEAALEANAVDIVVSSGFAAQAADLDLTAREIVDSEAQIAIIVAAGAESARMLAALDEVGARSLSNIVVNGAVRGQTSSPSIQALSFDLRRKIIGVAPQAVAGPDQEPFDPPGPYAVNAYDCVNLVALAAQQAGTDRPDEVAAEIARVSSGGSVCTSFEQCREVLAQDFQIDYNGPSGVTEIRVRGEPSRARFDLFGFDENGVDEFESSFVVDG